MPPRTQRETLASERRRCVLRVRSSREDFELGTNFPNSKASGLAQGAGEASFAGHTSLIT